MSPRPFPSIPEPFSRAWVATSLLITGRSRSVTAGRVADRTTAVHLLEGTGTVMLRTHIAKAAAVASLVIAASLAAPAVAFQPEAVSEAVSEFDTPAASSVLADAGWQAAPADAGWQ